MIDSYRMLKEYIAADLERITEKKPSFGDGMKLYFHPQGTTFPYIFWFRVVQYLKSKHRWMAVIPYLRMRHFEFKYGIHANTNISVGKGLLIVHGGAVFMNCKSIGENFTIYQGVTLGSRKYGQKYKDEIPTIGDNVTIYTGAVVCGEITIGNSVRVGANSFVDKDVEEGRTIKGVMR